MEKANWRKGFDVFFLNGLEKCQVNEETKHCPFSCIKRMIREYKFVQITIDISQPKNMIMS